MLLLLLACSPATTTDSKTPATDDTGGAETGTVDDTEDTTDTGETAAAPDADGDGSPAGTDCDDDDADVHPGAPELCNAVDDDCDGDVDEDATDARTWYRDDDADGYGLEGDAVVSCDPVAGYADEAGDCDDTDYTVSPRATESCDGRDEDCDGEVDEGSPSDAATWYADADGDDYGDPTAPQRACEAPSGTTADASDCDDTDAGVNPDGVEVCDGLDNNCDGSTDGSDALDATTWYVDADGDTYGNPASPIVACEPLSIWVLDASDCDDTSADALPGGTEVCDHLDNDCDGATDEDDAVDIGTLYADLDHDGFGDLASPLLACFASADVSASSDDCDDGDARVHPGAADTCDGVDSDCDGRDTDAVLVPGDHATIQAALDVVVDGDTVCVAPGTWTEQIVIPEHDFSLVGGGGSAGTILDGDGAGPVVSIDGDDNLVRIEGFTITGGEAEEGAGIRIEDASPTLSDVVVTENRCEESMCEGTGVWVTGDGVTTMEGVRISDNVQVPGGDGCGLLSGYDSGNPTLIFTDVEVSGNEQLTDGDEGGDVTGAGVSTRWTDMVWTDVSIHDNYQEAAGEGNYGLGAGISIQDGLAIYTNVDVLDNQMIAVDTTGKGAFGRGAGITIYSEVDWVGGTIGGNSITQFVGSSAWPHGGGVYTGGDAGTIAHVRIVDNVIDATGDSPTGGGMEIGGSLRLESVIIANNRAYSSDEGADGGAAYISARGTIEFVNCDIVGNIAEGAKTVYGGALWVGWYSVVDITSTNIVNNQLFGANTYGGAISVYNNDTTITSTYSNFYGNTATEFNEYDSPVGVDGNLAEDPLYADTSGSSGADWDLTLGSGSACIDAGDPSTSDWDGSLTNIGAYGGLYGRW